MKKIYIFLITLIFTNAVNAQLQVKDTWSRALIASELLANSLGTDTIHKSITDTQAYALIQANENNDSFFIIDVRTPDEYKSGHLENSNNIDLNDSLFNQLIDSLDRDMSYLLYCGVGGRSKQVFNKMVSMHFREVYNMLGGFSKWKTNGFPYEVDTTTSIADYTTLTKDLKIYPNPATDQLTLESNVPLYAGNLSIFNMNGQVILKQVVKEIKSEIDISSLPSGVYMLQLSNNQTVGSRRFVKQ